MDDFNTIRLKKKTIGKFKKYSKKISPSYSENLDFMIAFFEDNDLSPYDVLNENMTSVSNRINKRIDAVIAIFRNVEETQLKPTKKMLDSLFDGMKEKKPLLKEKKVLIEPALINDNEELSYYRKAYYKNNQKLTKLKYKVDSLLNSTKLVKNTFGSNYYSLKLSIQEFNSIKNELKKVDI
ncbi:hypothetical protein SAMN05428642_1021140 [Flaviramulus basaltis]|uniref:Uncharacterized protein n=1 Tax=Flaviramulus basaltis TaxID=369401 RepID=A0A1K2ILE5_9FLAO|nr:BfmA/BtgA family mobilization protein [Flaviramulus basaltis]SFZ93032.1 hypothetical protein SAMN05428642_1021140 [Flaviramulus basaltis]